MTRDEFNRSIEMIAWHRETGGPEKGLVDGLLAHDAAQRQEIERLREAMQRSIDRANGRWVEWGERAEMCRDILEEAIAARPADERRNDG